MTKCPECGVATRQVVGYTQDGEMLVETVYEVCHQCKTALVVHINEYERTAYEAD